MIESEFTKLLASAIPHIIWTADQNGNVNYFNTTGLDYFGLPLKNLEGNKWIEVIHSEDKTINLQQWRNSFETGENFEIEHRLKRHDDIYRWHLTRAVPQKDSEGNVAIWVGTCTDINDHKTAESKKDEFLSIASHELKTPLTSAKAFVQLTAKHIEPESSVFPFITKADEHLNRLERLIADLLDVSKINAGKLMYNVAEFNFDEVLRDSVESVQHTASYHDIVIEESAKVKFKGDRFRIEQVINNFLTNAIKYSPNGDKVIVRSVVEQNNIIVSIQDFGIGIERKNLSRLFERFYRIDNTSMRYQGLGLGLYIASEIIKSHNGSFWIESEPGVGSTFYFLLPLSSKQQLTTLSTDSATYYHANYIDIIYNQEKHRLEADWKGFQNFESVKQGCLIMLSMLKRNQCRKILNDNTNVLGNWSEAVDWGGEVWFPAIERAGLQYFSWIYSPSTFSQMSAQRSVDIMVGNITTRFFYDKTDATEWLDSLE